MFERFKTALQRWRDLTEVSALSDRELDDIGISRDQLEQFVRMPADVPDRVLAMAAIFGLTEEELRRDTTLWRDLVCTCGACHDRGACALVLERGDLSRPRDCGFCLNAPTFQALATA